MKAASAVLKTIEPPALFFRMFWSIPARKARLFEARRAEFRAFHVRLGMKQSMLEEQQGARVLQDSRCRLHSGTIRKCPNLLFDANLAFAYSMITVPNVFSCVTFKHK